jgi:hypothetical protein
MPTAQPSLTGDQQNRLRADLDAVAAHLDARRGLLHRRTALPLLYTLTGPDGPRDAVRLRAESVGPTAWPELGDAGIVLTALALGIPPLAAGDVYGYALAYRPSLPSHDARRTGRCVILAVGRDAGVYLAGRGRPGPEYRSIAHGLEALVLAARRGGHADGGHQQAPRTL